MEIVVERCVILGAAPVKDAQALLSLLRPDDTLIAADGGYNLALKMGIKPSRVVADFDSAKRPSSDDTMDILQLPVRKDVTDTAAAVERGLEAGFREFLLIGCLGGRLDHEFANYQLLIRLAKQGCHGVLADEKNRVEAVCRSPVRIPHMPGWKLSLFAFGKPVTGLSISGTSYLLQNYCLQPEDSLCISNETVQECEICFENGILLLFHSKD